MKSIHLYFKLLCLLLLTGCSQQNADKSKLILYVAASLTDALQEIATIFADENNCEIVYNFAGSGALAQQLLAAPRADIYISANQKWVDKLEAKDKLLSDSRKTLLSNQLVIIASNSSNIQFNPNTPIASHPFKYLCMGDPTFVPAGRYAQKWLSSINQWEKLKSRVSPTPNVRAVLIQTESNKELMGIVYRTDYNFYKDRVRLLYEVPLQEAPKIEYAAAILKNSSSIETAKKFMDFLHSEMAQEIFNKHGFITGH